MKRIARRSQPGRLELRIQWREQARRFLHHSMNPGPHRFSVLHAVRQELAAAATGERMTALPDLRSKQHLPSSKGRTRQGPGPASRFVNWSRNQRSFPPGLRWFARGGRRPLPQCRSRIAASQHANADSRAKIARNRLHIAAR